ncbi:Rrf2 family transcriptional regulator [Brevibacillus laterosporus]|uniref:Rrf2 family transcriptional regulator n=1 Tax=Brevibacillus TaxID=55080 RepID=UPI001B0E9794|nr:Rrf2 family transcriptional regulator [Brevibacillus halotolerans]GIN99457.1 putative HTH-type transcriptional regulator YwnA [Brevibacillus halotolerans]
MVNSRFAVAIHILSIVASTPCGQATSAYIAGSVNTNPVVIRRISSMLKKAGMIESKVGSPGATLTKSPEEITLLDVYKAVQSPDELFAIHEEPNPACPIGRQIQHTLTDVFFSAQQAMEQELASKTVADVLSGMGMGKNVTE